MCRQYEEPKQKDNAQGPSQIKKIYQIRYLTVFLY